MNSKEFSLKIESIVKEKRITYMDAVIDYCNNNDIDLGTVNPMINKSLKEKIKRLNDSPDLSTICLVSITVSKLIYLKPSDFINFNIFSDNFFDFINNVLIFNISFFSSS